MNIAAHKSLNESSVAFGVRETMLAEQGKADTEKRVKYWDFKKMLTIVMGLNLFYHILS